MTSSKMLDPCSFDERGSGSNMGDGVTLGSGGGTSLLVKDPIDEYFMAVCKVEVHLRRHHNKSRKQRDCFCGPCQNKNTNPTLFYSISKLLLKCNHRPPSPSIQSPFFFSLNKPFHIIQYSLDDYIILYFIFR